jgi:hypothetical protein
MRTALVTSVAALALTTGCATRTIGQDTYQVSGSSGATLGSYGIKDRSGAHSFEHFGTPKAIEDLRTEGGVEVLVEFDQVTTRTVSVSPASDVASGSAAGSVAFITLAKPHTVVERIPKTTLIEIYRTLDPAILAQLRSDPQSRIVTSVVREVDSIVLTGLSEELKAGISPQVASALVAQWLASAPVVEGPIRSDSKEHRVYLGGRVTAYQMSHLCWEDGKLVGLKTDRPRVDDELPPGWQHAEPVAQPVVAKD